MFGGGHRKSPSHWKTPIPPVYNCTFVNLKDQTEEYPSPDPNHFKIVKAELMGRYILAWINYPNCKNFEGDKILVFKDLSIKKLQELKTLDPHFTKSPKSPIARFKPTPQMWEVASHFITYLNTYKDL